MNARQQLELGPQFDGLIRRLRAWSVPGWRHGDRIGCVRAALQQLADLGSAAAGSPAVDVPALRTHALADQLVVLAREALSSGADRQAVETVISALVHDLGLAPISFSAAGSTAATALA